MATARIPNMSCLARRLQGCSIIRESRQARRYINTTAPVVESEALSESMLTTPLHSKTTANGTPISSSRSRAAAPKSHSSHSPRYSLSRLPQATSSSTPSPIPVSSEEPAPSSSILPDQPLDLSQSVRENLSYLLSQPPYYITVHIYGKPYLVTAGDTVRLPFLMDGVMPGDVLRLNRAVVLGSRDWTLKPGFDSRLSSTITPSAASDSQVDTSTSAPIVGKMEGLDAKTIGAQSWGTGAGVATVDSQKTINRSNKAPLYLDERLFTCRAVVMGTESEPMRVMEKTKRRQRHTKHVKSKHKYTILKIREVSVNSIAADATV